MNLSGGFSLTALMDGSTIDGVLRVEGTPLVQRYNKHTEQFIPRFDKLSENQKPTLVLILRDSTTGEIVNPQTVEWKYNDVPLTFDPETNLCTNEGEMKGLFKRIPAHSSTVGAETLTFQALRVMNNLVPISDYDNDRISVSGTVEFYGHSIPFVGMHKEVIIQESAGNAYDIVISDDKGSVITKEGESLTCTATLFKDGIEVTEYEKGGFSFQWYKVSGDGDVAWEKTRAVVVKSSDIHNVLKLRCDISQKGSVIASGLTQITDYSDPYVVDFVITGITGNGIKRGETAKIKPVARKRSTGDINEKVTNWNFNIKNNRGEDFKLTGKDGPTFTATEVNVTFNDMMEAEGGLSGIVSTSF